jgi:hypothetical protein
VTTAAPLHNLGLGMQDGEAGGTDFVTHHKPCSAIEINLCFPPTTWKSKLNGTTKLMYWQIELVRVDLTRDASNDIKQGCGLRARVPQPLEVGTLPLFPL